MDKYSVTCYNTVILTQEDRNPMNTDKQLSESKENDLEQIIWNAVKKLDKRIWIVLFSSVCWGILAHGMALFNKYSVYDDNKYMFKIGATYSSGRWMLDLLGKIYLYLFGGGFYSLPLFNGAVTIMLIAVSAYLMIHILDIRQTGLCVAVTGIMIAFPVVTAILGYMFTAPYYMTSLLLATSGIWVANRKKSVLNFSAGIFLMACSIGVYQAFIPVMLSLVLLCFIRSLTADTTASLKSLVLSGLYLFSAVISGILLYFLINKFFLSYYDLTLNTYRNINTMGKESVLEYLSRIPVAYYRFLVTSDIRGTVSGVKDYTSMYPFRLRHIYLLMLLFTALLSLRLIVRTFRKNFFRGFLLTLAVLMLPVAFNFIFIMCAADTVYTLMLYGQVMVFVYLMWLLDNSVFSICNLTRAVYGIGAVMLLFISVSYCRYANINYLKGEYQQQRMISYFTVLITQIKSTPGYRDELPVVYINPKENKDTVVKELNNFELFNAPPYYGIYEGINDLFWIYFMNDWCAFSPELADEEDFKDLPEVIEMPYYPDDGSIQIINDTVVVKFGPVEE